MHARVPFHHRGMTTPSATVGDRGPAPAVKGGMDWLFAIAVVAIAYALARVIYFTPDEAIQGPAQKIFYLHLPAAVSYTHLRAHETGRNLVCRLLLEKKK